jgi:hypothetical protein
MKHIIDNNDTNIIDTYLGEITTIFCCRYIYTGKVIKIDDKHLVLEGCKIVYETGEFCDKNWKDAQSLETKEWVIALQSIESFGKINKS